jgi:hypothetical protein
MLMVLYKYHYNECRFYNRDDPYCASSNHYDILTDCYYYAPSHAGSRCQCLRCRRGAVRLGRFQRHIYIFIRRSIIVSRCTCISNPCR